MNFDLRFLGLLLVGLCVGGCSEQEKGDVLLEEVREVVIFLAYPELPRVISREAAIEILRSETLQRRARKIYENIREMAVPEAMHEQLEIEEKGNDLIVIRSRSEEAQNYSEFLGYALQSYQMELAFRAEDIDRGIPLEEFVNVCKVIMKDMEEAREMGDLKRLEAASQRFDALLIPFAMALDTIELRPYFPEFARWVVKDRRF